jgi:putative copper resistance protein D
MLPALASADFLTWLSILVKAMTYAATLLAAGSVLAHVFLRTLDPVLLRSLALTAFLAAIAAALLSVLRLPLRASFLMGGTLEGALDPMMLGMVSESPLGTAVAVRLAGLALIPAVLVRRPPASWIAVSGAVLVCASFALRGHALGEPRVVLGALVTVHLLGVAFWLGAFAPLFRAAGAQAPAQAGALAHEFGTAGIWVVGGLVVAGGLTLVLLGVATPSALTTPYGQLMAVKLAIFAGILALAALNKLRLTPALLAGSRDARRKMRRSILIEVGLIGLVLLTTAAFTTVSSPPKAATRTSALEGGPPRLAISFEKEDSA